MTSYQIIYEYVRQNGKVVNLAKACKDGVIPVSYDHAKVLVRLACKRGHLRRRRDKHEQGRPLVIEVTTKQLELVNG